MKSAVYDDVKNIFPRYLGYVFIVQLNHIKGTWSAHSFNGDYLSIP